MTRPSPLIVALLPTEADSPNPLDPIRLAGIFATHGAYDAVAIAAGGKHVKGDHIRAPGVDRVWSIADASLGGGTTCNELADAFTAALRAPEILAGWPPQLIRLPYGPCGEELAARIAARMDGTALGRCSGILLDEAGCVARRSSYGGRVDVRLRATRAPYVAVLRPGVVEKTAGSSAREPEIRIFDPGPLKPSAEHVSRIPHAGKRYPPLEGAKLIVSGGRGMGGPESFALLRELADRLGGAVGGSLPAADAGWLPISRQIGQSGKYVTPEIYIAIGISGTSQHLAGIGDAARIIVINQDPDAPIWRIGEIGAIADWREIVPALLKRLASQAAT